MSDLSIPLLTMAEAVKRLVPDGSSIAIGLTPRVPDALVDALIRQQRVNLTLIVATPVAQVDALVAAGCVRTLIAAELGDEQGVVGPGIRRAVEQQLPHAIELRDHSTLTLGLALLAGSLGVPFIPTYSGLGSELSSTNTDLIERINPLNERGEPLLLVRALQPDVAVLHVPRAAADGSVWLPSPTAFARQGAQAAKRLLVTADEIVPADAIPPHERLLPPLLVSALVHAPGGHE